MIFVGNFGPKFKLAFTQQRLDVSYRFTGKFLRSMFIGGQTWNSILSLTCLTASSHVVRTPIQTITTLYWPFKRLNWFFKRTILFRSTVSCFFFILFGKVFLEILVKFAFQIRALLFEMGTQFCNWPKNLHFLVRLDWFCQF